MFNIGDGEILVSSGFLLVFILFLILFYYLTMLRVSEFYFALRAYLALPRLRLLGSLGSIWLKAVGSRCG